MTIYDSGLLFWAALYICTYRVGQKWTVFEGE